VAAFDKVVIVAKNKKFQADMLSNGFTSRIQNLIVILLDMITSLISLMMLIFNRTELLKIGSLNYLILNICLIALIMIVNVNLLPNSFKLCIFKLIQIVHRII